MNAAAAFAIASASLGVGLALMVHFIARSPGLEDERPFAAVALTAGLSAAANLHWSLPVAEAWAFAAARVQIALLGLHVAAWHRYACRSLKLEAGLPCRLMPGATAGAALLGLWPGLVYSGAVGEHEVAGIRYLDLRPTPAGLALMGLYLLSAGFVAWRFLQALRRGSTAAGASPVPLVGLASVIAMGAHDALVTTGLLSSPYLLDFGFLVPIVGVGYALVARYTSDAAALQALQASLSAQVEERSAELARAQEALHRAEKLAALGQLAAGIAHELNNPTAAVTANLEFIQGHLDASGAPRDTRDAARESRESMDRVARTVRQLLDAGRAALSAPEERVPVSLAAVAEAAARAALARFGTRVRLADLVPSSLFALGQERALAHVVGHLVANAVQAIPPGKRDGQVVLRGEREGSRVRLWVEDNGVGFAEEALRRLFEPYFSTRAFGAGAGLGLAVSRGLVASLGGELRLESQPGHGTRALVELDACEPPPPRAAEEETGSLRLVGAAPAGPRRLLVVDDEPAVLSSLRRLLEKRYHVTLAFSVDEALRRLSEERFDLVLCDLMMPEGGGARLHAELVRLRPAAAARLIFLTGGAVTDEARRYLEHQPQPVLEKPLDIEQLLAAERRLVPVSRPTPPPATRPHRG